MPKPFLVSLQLSSVLDDVLGRDISYRRQYQPDSPLLDDLNGEQRAVCDVLIDHYQSILRGESLPPLEINLDDKAGTGKTSVILMAVLR